MLQIRNFNNIMDVVCTSIVEVSVSPNGMYIYCGGICATKNVFSQMVQNRNKYSIVKKSSAILNYHKFKIFLSS